jgi:D-alanine-D-alanine ligase
MVPNWQVCQTEEITGLSEISFPSIVKPSAEGSGMGIDDRSIVDNLIDLRAQVSWILERYKQPALVQEFVSGREFTIGVIEAQGDLLPFVPLELCPLIQENNFIYHHGVKEQADQLVVFRPLENDQLLIEQIQTLAVAAFKALGCRDAARIDIRLSDAGIAHFLEINPIPHLHPKIGDFCRSALKFGIDYEELIRTIMENVVNRYNLK